MENKNEMGKQNLQAKKVCQGQQFTWVRLVMSFHSTRPYLLVAMNSD